MLPKIAGYNTTCDFVTEFAALFQFETFGRQDLTKIWSEKFCCCQFYVKLKDTKGKHENALGRNPSLRLFVRCYMSHTYENEVKVTNMRTCLNTHVFRQIVRLPPGRCKTKGRFK